MSQNTVGEWMSQNPVTISLDLSVADAAARMHEHQIRHLPVMSHEGHLVGLLSSRDVALVNGLPGVNIEKLQVQDAMNDRVYTVNPETSLNECVTHMRDHKFGAAVVMSEGKCVGMFTVIDALGVLSKHLNN